MYKLEEIIKEIQAYDHIIIYGAGLVSCAFVEFALANDIDITFIAVSEQSGNPKHILGIPVVKAEQAKEFGASSIVVIATLENLHDSIEMFLQKLGFYNIIRLTNTHYALLRKRNREFSMDVLSELQGFRRSQDKSNLAVLQKIYNMNRDLQKLKSQVAYQAAVSENYTENPMVTVIIPVYNVEKYLAECLNSVINQTIKKLEIICVEDGSTDQSLEILRRFSERYPFIKVIQQENRGLSAARNTGLESACGEYVYFLDSDDFIEERALQKMYEMAQADCLDVLYIDGRSIYENKELEEALPEYKCTYHRPKSYSEIVKGTELFCNMVEDGTYYVQASLQFIRLGFLKEVKLKFFEGILYEDNLFNFECMLQASAVKHCNYPYFIRRIRKNSIMTTERVTVKNFYGYFITYIQMLSFAVEFHADERSQYAMETIIEGIYHLTKRYYDNLPEEERSKLMLMTPIERLALKQLKL